MLASDKDPRDPQACSAHGFGLFDNLRMLPEDTILSIMFAQIIGGARPAPAPAWQRLRLMNEGGKSGKTYVYAYHTR